MISQIHPLLRCVGHTADLWFVAIHTQHIVVHAEVNIVFIFDARQIKMVTNFFVSLYNVHRWHDSRGHTLKKEKVVKICCEFVIHVGERAR